MKRIILIVFLTSSFIVWGQSKKIKLTEAIALAQQKSPEYKTLVNQAQASYWRNRNFIAEFLPQFRLDARLPDYSNSITRIVNDEGQDIFVNQNQARFDTQLSINQQVPYTGGTFSLNTQLQRIDRFGDNESTSYSVIPFSLQYSQNSLFYNSFKWDKKIEPLIYEEAKRNYVERMEDISLSTCRRYFGLLKAQVQLQIAKKNLSNQDTLYQIAQGRFRMGKIAENELLQMELSQLNSKNDVTTNTILLKKTSQDLARYLELETESIELQIPEKLADFTVTLEKALKEAYDNRKDVIEFRRIRLEAEKRLAQVKGNNRLEIDVRANFGLNRRSDEFDALFQDYDQQQNLVVNLGIPIFDWGVSKSRRKMAEADLGLTETNIEQDEQAFEQEIFLHTLNWSSQKDFLKTSEKAKEVALKSYEISKKRYILGKITIRDLNLSQQEKDRAAIAYLNSLEKFWLDYYLMRRLTLFDFIANEKITATLVKFD